MASFSILDQQSARRMAGLLEGDITAIQKLCAIGKKAEDIVRHIKVVGQGGDAAVDFSPKGPTTVTLQAYSFLKDANQYSRCGITPGEAADMLTSLSTDPQGTLDAVHRIFTSFDAKRRGVARPVTVTLDGAPSSKVPGAKVSGDDGGYRALGQIMQQNPVAYGLYNFTSYDTNSPGTERFAIDLGSNLSVVAQSKKLAVRAAKIVSIDGRDFPAVSRFVRFRTHSGGPLLTNSSIPSGFWSGQRSALQSAPAVSTVDVLTGRLTAPVVGKETTADEESEDESDDEGAKPTRPVGGGSPQAKGPAPKGGSPSRAS